MSGKWDIVTLSEADYDAVLALWQAAGLSIRPDGRDSRAQYVAQAAQDTQTVIGARDGGVLIGVIVATHDGRKGWLNRLAVHPEHRRRGIGMALVQAAEQVLQRQGLQITAALIEDWNDASQALMTRAGYITHPDVHYLSKREHDEV